MNAPKGTIPKELNIERGQTQKNVNKHVLTEILKIYDRDQAIHLLDLPCGKREFLSYMKKLYPNAVLTGADIVTPAPADHSSFVQMDLSRNFTLPEEETYDIITSISGVMMFGNTQKFIENCVKRLKKGGTLIVTNDNPATIKDRLAYFFLGRFRIFDQIFEDSETMTKLVLIQDLTRLLRINGISIRKIEYTSFYGKDIIYLPLALIIYPLQLLYLSTRKTALPRELIFSKYNIKQLFCRHYIVTGTKS